MDDIRTERFIIINTLMIGFVLLFIIFIANSLLGLLSFTRNNSDFLYVQWGLLIFGLIVSTATVLWWIFRGRKENIAYQQMLATLIAIYRSQAIIEFNMDGTISTANDKFLKTIGYSLDELVGKHHSILVEPAYKESAEYRAFWDKLRRGEYEQAEYKRVKKNGQIVWLQSTYNPIFNDQGIPIKVIKVATDVTERKTQEAQLAKLAEDLHKVGLQIVADSNDLSVGINQLETTAVTQASSAAEQAASMTEISATIEEIKLSTQQTHEKAKQLGDSAEQTTKEADNGNIAIDKMGECMQTLQDRIMEISNTILNLNDKTQQIGVITETVADIAKQLKLLALNASIEAAKAGESGKGFAVVAGEVKDLAEKSRLSTDRVQKILHDIRQTAEQAVFVTEAGTKGVDENMHQLKITGEIINSLGKIIEESSVASLQIVAAVREESVAIGQIDQSMKEVNKVTTLFASASEQTKQAIIGLSKVADSLKNTAEVYKQQT